jgi:hypothetical protein
MNISLLSDDFNEYIKFTNDNRGKEISIRIERNGEIKEFSVTPRLNPPTGEGALGVGLIEAGLEKQNFFASIWDGLKTSFQVIQIIFLFMLIKHLNECEEFIAGDNTMLRELLHPDKADMKLRYSLAHATVRPGMTSYLHSLNTSEVYYILHGLE